MGKTQAFASFPLCPVLSYVFNIIDPAHIWWENENSFDKIFDNWSCLLTDMTAVSCLTVKQMLPGDIIKRESGPKSKLG